MKRAQLEALLVLLAMPGLGERRVGLLLQRHGSPDRALRAVRRGGWRVVRGGEGAGRAGDAPAAGGGRIDRADTRAAAAAVEERVAQALQVCAALDVQLLASTDPAYPSLPIEVPPPLLFLRGDVSLLGRAGVAVVGTRTCTAYGVEVAGQMAGALARAGVVVVSGLARGIDAAAHEAALDAEGATIAVLGCGIDVHYPPEHRALQQRIAARGLLVSQFLPGAPPLPDHFIRRNRIIAGLSRIAVVVEGSHRSGALSTAKCALDQGADVFAVPGPVGRATSEGPLALLRDGAQIYTEPADLLIALGMSPTAGGPAAPAAVAADFRDAARVGRGSAAAGAAVVTPVRHGAVLRALGRDPRHVDIVAGAADLPATAVLDALLELELDGRVEQLPGMRFRRRV